MAINIQSLFSDIIETPAQKQRRLLEEGLVQASAIPQSSGLVRTGLATDIMRDMPRQREQFRRNVGGMLGLDVRTESEKVQDALKGLDIENIDSTRSTAKTLQDMGLGLQAAQLLSLSEQRIAEKAVRERELAVAESQAETAKTRAETAAEQVELGREELQFNETVQEDLVNWRDQQVSDLELDRVLKRDELDLRARLAELQKKDLDSRTTAYLQELDVKSSELYEDARQTRALAEEFNAAEAAELAQAGLDEAAIANARRAAIREAMEVSGFGEEDILETFDEIGLKEGGIVSLAEGGMLDFDGKEMDLRGGGFVPIGKKEKADDVPARLSKNEFVMTADAVRAAGGGSVNKGAQRMYDVMNKLEARA